VFLNNDMKEEVHVKRYFRFESRNYLKQNFNLDKTLYDLKQALISCKFILQKIVFKKENCVLLCYAKKIKSNFLIV